MRGVSIRIWRGRRPRTGQKCTLDRERQARRGSLSPAVLARITMALMMPIVAKSRVPASGFRSQRERQNKVPVLPAPRPVASGFHRHPNFISAMEKLL